MSALLAQVGDGAADVLDDRGLDAFGRLVEEKQPGPGDERPADGELLLLAAGEVAAAPAQHGFQHREELEDLVRESCARRAAAGAKPVSRFSRTVRSGKISRPCGT